MTDRPLIAFYGDDFTGSTDALECLAASGLRAVLFTDVPSPERLARFEGLQAMGIAGNSRSLTPEEMEGVIPDALDALRRSGAPVLHYKVCSTFDSSPKIGSFGRVMDIAKRVLRSGTIPIVVGAPKLARYSMFGTLFARHNVDGTVHRIDRHPTMSVHPTTPMGEADMRRHIGAQTRPVDRAPSRSRNRGLGLRMRSRRRSERGLESKPDALMIDIADEARKQGSASAQEMARQQTPLLSSDRPGSNMPWSPPGEPRARFCTQVPMPSPGRLIDCSLFQAAARPLPALRSRRRERRLRRCRARSCRAHRSGRGQASTRGMRPESHGARSKPDGASLSIVRPERTDPREAGRCGSFCTSRSLAGGRPHPGRPRHRFCSRTAARACSPRANLNRFVVAGGDTSTTAVKMLRIDALEMIAPLTPGAPLCRALAPDRYLDGREVVLKGGQMGGPSFFSQVRAGRV